MVHVHLKLSITKPSLPVPAFAVMPALRKIYKDDSELTEAMDNHFKYFNCMPWLTNLILGATLALEDNQGIQAKDAVQDLKKVSLMGPLSGIGDSIFFILIPTIWVRLQHIWHRMEILWA